jgi:hypothetical protein
MNIKKPAALLENKGAFKVNPARKRVDPEAGGTVGKAPSYFTSDQKAVWKELKEILPKGLKTGATDRWIIEIAVTLMDKFRSDGLNAAETAQFLTALGRLGMSPVDRARCAVPVTKPSKDNNEFGEFV